MSEPRFVTPLETRHLGPQRKLLLEDLVYESLSGRVFVVPAGFVSDGASVPRFLWSLYPPFGEAYEPATWLHDFCYQHAEELKIERAQADALMREASRACGFRGRGAAVMYAGVRSGGWLPWRRARAARATAQATGV